MNVFQPIHRLAIVNRGEAAMRCIRAVKALRTHERSELRVIALYTDVDRDTPFVRHADAVERLDAPRGEVAAYLDHDGLLDALRRAGADAVWPGWGFVAEDPRFVERVTAAGIRFLGPSAEAMRRLGDKISAKEIAAASGVPVSAWSEGVVENVAQAAAHAARIGYPVVVKATAGGGGRGIRVVTRPEDLAAAFASAGSEAQAAFGDGRLFLERKVTGGRHIEVQIAADQDGVVLALGCRDCSVQRRHQKVLEEAPPPGSPPRLLAELSDAAVRIAQKVGYSGVGTVEFLVSDAGHFFLEMNPRLQVEHGVTESLTGIDLVQLQIRIARGETLALLALREEGFAIEARVCAEDPDAGLPAGSRPHRPLRSGARAARAHRHRRHRRQRGAGRLRFDDREGDRDRRHARGGALAPLLRAHGLRPGGRRRRHQQELPARRADLRRLPPRRRRHRVARPLRRQRPRRARVRDRGADRGRDPLLPGGAPDGAAQLLRRSDQHLALARAALDGTADRSQLRRRAVPSDGLHGRLLALPGPSRRRAS